MSDLRAMRLGAKLLHGLLQVQAAPVDRTVSLLDLLQDIFSKATPLQTHLVVPANLSRVSIRDHERRNVLHDLGTASGDCMPADAAELVNSGEAADDGEILNRNVPRDSAVIGENYVVTDDAIVGNVRVREEVSPTSDSRDAPRAGAAVHRAELAKGILITHLKKGGFADVF